MIQCAINDPEIIKSLYSYVVANLKEAEKKGSFDPNEFMQNFYNELKANGSPEAAAKYIASLPKLISSVYTSYFFESNINIDVNKLKELNISFRSEDGINNVLKEFDKPIDADKINASINTDDISENEIEIKETVINEPVIPSRRFRTFSPLTGTGQSYVKIKPSAKNSKELVVERIDPNKIHIVNTMASISNSMNNQSITDGVIYQGKKLFFRAYNLNDFATGNRQQLFDKTTEDEIIKARSIGDKTPKGVLKINERVVLILSDEAGNQLYFDDAGNISNENEGKIVYQFLRPVRVVENKLVTTNIYSDENAILTPKEIARSTYKEEFGDKQAYLDSIIKEQEEDLATLKKIQDAALRRKPSDAAYLLPITGMTNGITTLDSATTISLENLITFPNQSKKIISTIETQSKESGVVKKGGGTIEINSERFPIDRMRITNDIAKQISEIIIEPGLTVQQKYDFIKQFIPIGMTKSVRNFDITYNFEKNSLFLTIYEKPNLINQIAQYNLSNTNLNNVNTAKASEDLFNALTEGYNGYATFISYDNDALRNNSYRIYKGGKTFEKDSYYNLILAQNPNISLIENNPGFFNYSLQFDVPTGPTVSNIVTVKAFRTSGTFSSRVGYAQRGSGLYYALDKPFQEVLSNDPVEEVTVSYDPSKTLDATTEEGQTRFMDIKRSAIEGKSFKSMQESNDAVTEAMIANGYESLIGWIEQDVEEAGRELVLYKPIAEKRQEPVDDEFIPVNTTTAADIEATRLYNIITSPEYIDEMARQGILASESWHLNKLLKNEIQKNSQYTKEFAREVLDSLILITNFSQKQINIINNIIDSKVDSAETKSGTDIIQNIVKPEAPQPHNNPTNSNKPDDLIDGLFRRAKNLDEKISEKKIKQSIDWWNSPGMKAMRDAIDLNPIMNIVNSDIYATFIVSAGTLANPDRLGKINYNVQKGSVFQNLTIYHEAWHAFSQLFLTPQQKTDLYNEMRSLKGTFTLENGETYSYSTAKIRQLEEKLAEDFRNYMKTEKPETKTPVKNTIFRQILNFLKALLGKFLKKFNKKDVTIDALNSPMAKELFNNLRVGNLNSYKPLISNAELFSLDRGVRNVENPREDVLSKQDSTQLVSAIDSIIAEIIDARYKKYKNVPGAKAITIATLVETQRREILLNEVREVLEKKLKTEKDKLNKLKPNFDFNGLSTLQNIKDYASAKLTNKKGDHKYVFLASQILDFSKLDPSLKKGERVKGESYAGTIKIVSDFYKHKEIKNENGKPVDIIVVSNLEDAEVQYNNYVKGEAKAYTGFELNQKALQPNLNLSEDEALILDNIRILQLTLSNWGDNKSGVIKYYLENTDYEVAKKKYETDYTETVDADGNTIDQTKVGDGVTSQLEINNDNLKGKVSLQQLMSKETAYILKSLFKVDSQGNTPVDRFGFKQRADFSKIFNIVAKTIGGIRDRQKAYDALVREAEKFPEIKQLIESKYPEPNTRNTYEFDISRQFLQDFGKAKVKYMQLFATLSDNGEFDLQSVQASLSISSIQGRWISEFKSSPKTPYINKSANNVSSLNLNAIVSEFREKSGNLKKSKSLEFAQAIGIGLDTNKNIISELDKNSDYYGLPYIFDAVIEFNELQLLEQAGQTLTPLQKEYLDKFRLNPLETLKTTVPKDVFTGIIKEDFNENTQLRRLAELQGKYGYDSATAGVIRSNGNTGYEDINYSTYSARLDALNNVEKITDLWQEKQYSYMSYLDPTINTYTRHLKILNSIFDRYEKNGDRKKGRYIEAIAVDGTNINDDLGNTTTELDDKSKFLQEIHSMLLAGWAELPRISEKKFSQGFRVIGGIENGLVLEKGADKNLYVDINMFFEGNKGENYAIVEYLSGYLEGEFDRIKKFKGSQRNELLKITGYNRVVDEVNGKKIYAGEVFSAFDTVLSPETKTKLYNLIEENINVNLRTSLKTDRELARLVSNDFKNYFNELVSDYSKTYYQDVPYLSESLLRKAGVKLSESPTSEELKAIRNNKTITDNIIKAYAYNDWIHKFETSIIMFGDFAQWDHAKEDWSKRIPGATSDGTGFLYDQGTQDFINNTFNAPYEIKNESGQKVEKLRTYAAIETAKTNGKINYDNYVFSDILNTAVIQDIERKSIYLDDMKAAWKEEFSKTYDNETAEYFTKLNAEAFEKMTEGDGMAYMTIDAYRALHKTGRGWSIAQENLYQKIINGEKVTQAEAAQYFPIYKLHYFGALKNDLIATTAMHKFSVMPLIPGVNAKEGSQLDKLHKKMLRENVQYVTFGSGSKAANLTSTGKLDNIFASDQQKAISDDVEFTLNPIYLANLKEVTVINDEFKGELPIATQTRAIILDNLFENGKIKNENNKQIIDSYLNTIKDYTKLLQSDLLNEIGYVYNEETKRYEGNLKNFVEFIREELAAKDIPNHLVKLINTTEDGQLTMDLSIHPESQDIEQLLMSVIQKRLIKQKTNGEPLVQAPTSFTNGWWDTQFSNVTDPEERKKLLGSNTLPFYLRGEIINKETGERAATKMMKVAISLQGSYNNLLNQVYKGQKIGTIERLNELIKDEEWLNTGNNRKAITIGGPRIPNDATNTIEGAEVWHFVDPAFGNTVIVPTEIVAKAGSDFDGDKLFFAMANIDKDGNYISKGISDFENKLKKAQELEKQFEEKKASNKKLTKEDFEKLPEISSEQLIEQQKRYLQNKYIETHTSLLALPENYAYLVTPNLTHLVDKYIPYLEKTRSGYDRYKNPGNIEPNKSAPDKDGKRKTVISPTRLLEATYNLYKHAANLSLEPSLGIQAKITKNHTIFKTIGAKMPNTYKDEFFNLDTGELIIKPLELPLVMRFLHNVVRNEKGELVISLSGEKTQKGSRITDLNSHNLNGILDRAKNPFPFDLQMTPEGINVISYLIQAGVNEEEVFMFVNQPLIKKYMEDQRLMNSAYYTIINGQKASKVKSTALYDIAIPILDTLNDGQKTDLLNKVNREKLRAAINTVRKLEDQNVFVITPNASKGRLLSINDLANELNSKKITEVDKIFLYNKSEDKYNIILYKSASEVGDLLDNSTIPFTTEVLSRTYLPAGDIRLETLYDGISTNDSSSLKSLALFMNFIELEKQFEGMDNLQQSFAPDTSTLTTTQQVRQRKSNYKMLAKSSKIDNGTFERLTKDSVVSSFNVDDLILDLILPLFPLRLNVDISTFISDKIVQERRLIKSKFGTGIKGQENFTKAYNNGVINFIYQNYISNFQNEDGKLVNVGPEVGGFPTLIDDNADFDAIVENGVMIINTKAIEDDFNNKVFLEGNTTARNYAEQGLDVFKPNQNPFLNLNSYYRYVLEREALRVKNPIESLENDLAYKEFLSKLGNIPEDAYEAWLSEKALRDSYNKAYIMGSTKYSYSDTILDLIRGLSDKVKSEYPILSQIAPAETRRANVKLLQLNNKKLVKGQLAEIYYSNLRNLGDVTIKKVDDPELNKRISDLFNEFSLMMFYQHGVGPTKFGFTKALDPEQYQKLMRYAVDDFFKNYFISPEDTNKILNRIYDTVVSEEMFKNYSVPLKGFHAKEVKDEFIESFDLLTGLSEGPVIMSAEDIASYNTYLSKSNNIKPKVFFTPKTLFTEFYNNVTGKRQTMPESAQWNLNSYGYYDMIDNATKEVYIQNVDLATGKKMLLADEVYPKSSVKPGRTPASKVVGINISTKSSDKLGRELTNPNWGAKNIMDIEAEYKANASKIKAPNLNAEEALRYDMNLMYKLQMKKFKAHPELVKEITDRGGVPFLEASEHTVGVKGSRWEGKGTDSNFIKVLIRSYQDSLKANQAPVSATNNPAEYTNHSGGANGSDTEWDVIGKEFGMVNNNHYYTGVKSPKNAPLGNVDITDEPIAVEGASKVAQAAKQMWGYKYNTMKDQRLIRNWAQVANSDAVFAIGTLGKEGDIWKGDEKSAEPRKLLKFAVQGGTGYAVEMAIQAGKPVYVFDQVRNQWYKNINGEWSKSEVPTLTKNFAGIGTREINEAGKQAIRDVYANTFKATTQPTVPVGEVKEGVAELFKSNPELANIGTAQQYSRYLDTIFPDNAIVYRGSEKGRTDFQTRGFFTDKLSYAKEYAFDKGFVSKSEKEIVNTFLINTANVKNVGEMNTESVKNEPQDLVLKGTDKGRTKESGNVYATTSKNLHELGSKQDIEGFKEFVQGESFIKPGVSELFESKPVLSTIGTPEQYSNWINYLTTQGKLAGTQATDILYHGTYEVFEEFDEDKKGTNTGIITYQSEDKSEQFLSDSANTIFFSDRKTNAISYTLLGRDRYLSEILDALQNVRSGVKDYVEDAVEVLKGVPYFNNLIDKAKKEGKTTKEIIDLLGKEETRLARKYKEGSSSLFTNTLASTENSLKTLNKFLSNIDIFKKNNDIDFTNSTSNFRIFKKGNRTEFARFDKGKTVLTAERFYADEVTNDKIKDFINAAIAEDNNTYAQVKKDMKSVGFEEKAMPVLLNLQNPSVHDYEGSAFPDVYKNTKTRTAAFAAKQVADALKNGNDGVIYENIVDPLLSNSYGVFDVKNIYILGGTEDIQGFKNFVSGQPTVEPVTSTGEPTIQEEDMKVFQAALKDNDGVLPNKFIVSLPTGTRTWIKNSRNLYDLVDENTILLRNVNMESGLVEEATTTPVDESKRKALIDQFTNLRKTMPIDEILAEKGIDANDVLLNLQKAKTQEELLKIETEILKKLC